MAGAYHFLDGVWGCFFLFKKLLNTDTAAGKEINFAYERSPRIVFRGLG